MRIVKSVERWFNIPNDPDGGKLLIKHLTPGEAADIIDQVFVQKIDYKQNDKGKFEPLFTQNLDKTKDRELPVIKSVKGWENFFDDNDKVLEFNEENVLKASREITGFNELVTEFREILSKEIEKEKEVQIKN